MARRFVLMHDLFIGDAVDDAGRLLQHFQGGRLIAAFNRFANLLDRSAQSGAQTDIVSATFLTLFRAFSRLFGVCHGYRGMKKSIKDYKTNWVGLE
jgi:hypothetical protein